MHEHLDAYGIINMNGRVYDPLTAQFFSPDPFVQAPGSWLNYNRYGYCYNNPFRYTDPDGEFIITAIIVGAVIGAAIGTYSGYKIGQAHGATGWDMAGYMLGGAGIGTLGGAAAGGVGAVVSGAIGIGGFVGGAITGGAAGATGGLINGAGMTWLGGGTFGQGLTSGLIGACIGAGTGALLGGTVQGFVDLSKGNSFWNGKPITPTTPTASQPTPTQQSNNANAQPNQTPTQTQSNNLPANVDYPSNNGAVGSSETKYLYQGEVVDRFGETTHNSRYLSPEGTPIPSRSLPPSTNLQLREVYQVAKPFPVQSSTIAPYYGMPGMGTQYVTPLPIQLLVDKGVLIRVIITF
jgi:RHS repeat-associated protein